MPVEGQAFEGGVVRRMEDGGFAVFTNGQFDIGATARLNGVGGHQFQAVQGGYIDLTNAGAMAHAVAEKTAREHPGVTFKAGTVVSIDAQPAGQYITAHVAIDGDAPSNTTQAVSEVGQVAVGARVKVKFEPPQGVYLSGVLSNDCEPGEIVYSAFGLVTTDESPPWGPPQDSVVTSIETFAGLPGSTDTSISIAVNGEEQLAYVLGAGVAHMDLGENDGADFAMFQHEPVTVAIAPGTDLSNCTVIIRYCMNKTGRNTVTPTPPT